MNYRILVLTGAMILGLLVTAPPAEARTRVRGTVVQEWQCHRQFGCRWVTIGRVRNPRARARFVEVCDRRGCRLVRTPTRRRR